MHLFDSKGEKLNDPIKVANGICRYFITSVSMLRGVANPLCNFVRRTPQPVRKRADKRFNFRPVSRLKAKRDLCSIKRNKSTSIENLPPCWLKDIARSISSPQTRLISLSLQAGCYPLDWKIAKTIKPMDKPGSYSAFDNYRPISVLSFVSKIIEKAVHRHVMEFLAQNKLLSAFQFGFRPNFSSKLAATLLQTDIRKSAEEGKLVGAAFIDLCEAFDTISHSNLLEKLLLYGVHGMNGIGLLSASTEDQ